MANYNAIGDNLRALLRLASHAGDQAAVDPLLARGQALVVKLVAAVLAKPN